MSIKFRLLLSYVAMILIPLLLLGGAMIVIGEAFLGDLKSAYKLDLRHTNPILAVLEQEANVSADIQMRGMTNPDSLLDPAVQQTYEAKLQQINMGLIIRKNGSIEYISPRMNKPQLLRNLPPYGQSGREDEEHSVGEHGHWFIARQHDVTFTDGSKGSVFIVTDTNALGKFARSFSKLFFLTLLVIVVLTNGVLTYFVSRSFIRPLRSLKKAADEIKDGNLDFEIKPESRDEIGSLAASFEQMRRKLKESVELQLQYEENRKELISNISHDLKTPITAIKGYVEGIMDGITDTPEKLDKYVKTIYTKAVQMDQMIDELFLFSKLDLKKQPFHFEEVELCSFLQDCLDEMRMDAEKKGVSLKFDDNRIAPPIWVVADRDKLKRVLMNVIGNAMKYMDKEEGVIRLRLHDFNRYAAVEVQDNGQGISEEALPHIFDRFYRADLSRHSGTGGSGLGLAIAKQIIEEHDGSIWASSEKGKGTSIQFTLKKAQSLPDRRDQHEENPHH
jgi:signal transduction histidine kinase